MKSAGIGPLVALILSLSLVPTAARAQTVYSSLADAILPAATLPPAVAPKNGAADDYVTTLAGGATTFELASLSFVGGVQFTGAADGVNNVLKFRFLDQFGGIPVPVVSFPVAFTTSGDFLYTIGVGANGIPAGSFVPTNGILEVTTLNRDSIGMWAFTNTAPSVGFNNAGNSGVRAFSLQARIPEPATGGLLLLAVTFAIPGVFRRVRHSLTIVAGRRCGIAPPLCSVKSALADTQIVSRSTQLCAYTLE